METEGDNINFMDRVTLKDPFYRKFEFVITGKRVSEFHHPNRARMEYIYCIRRSDCDGFWVSELEIQRVIPFRP